MDNAEIWMDIPHYNGKYQISSLGRVWSVPRQRILVGKVNKDGYHEVLLLSPHGKRQYERVHRLVLLTFKPDKQNFKYTNEEDRKAYINCLEKLIPNHIDENKLNNRVDNLEWCTPAYNIKWSAYKWTGENNCMKRPEVRAKHKEACRLAHTKESKIVFDTLTHKQYESLHDAERKTGISKYMIAHRDRFIVSEIGKELATNGRPENR